MRISPSVNLNKLEAKIREWCAEQDAQLEFIQQFACNRSTPLRDDFLWWVGIKNVADRKKIKLEKEIFPAATDSRYGNYIDFIMNSPSSGIGCVRIDSVHEYTCIVA
jgi:hypothetical protein